MCASVVNHVSPPQPLLSIPCFPPPKYPEYSSLQSRLHSFVGWPQLVVGVTPASLAACGFFYIGSADRVRCFLCGVTLRNWEPEDDPATEHLTWSPSCPVALLPPGPDSQTGFRDVQAPPQSVRDGGTGGRVQVPLIESASRNFEELGVNIAGLEFHAEPSPASTQTGVAHSLELTARVHGNAATAARQEPPSVLAVLELGCSRDVVDRVRERRRRLQGTDFPDSASLMTAVLEMEELMSQSSRARESNGHASTSEGIQPLSDFPPGEASGYRADTGVSTSQSSVTNSNARTGDAMDAAAGTSSLSPSGAATQVRDRQLGFRQCRLCPQGEVTVTFLPCGHIIACSDCAQKCQACPRCGKSILGTVRTYFA